MPVSHADTVRLVVGCMTGTSVDGLDAALVRVDGHGLSMRAKFVAGVSASLGELAGPLRALGEQTPMPAAQIAALARDFSLAHTRAVRALLESEPARAAMWERGPNEHAGHAGRACVDLIAVHGQTVAHAPPVSWQMFNPWPLVEATGARVVFDLRGADLARGGQGAPITPLADLVLLAGPETRAVINLGGFCNVTLLPAVGPGADMGVASERVQGLDVCVCNLLLDAIARERLGVPYDAGGEAALSGRVHEPATGDLLNLLEHQRASGRSLGTGDESLAWVARWAGTLTGADLCASACEAIGRTIGRAVHGAQRVLLAGGGANNRALVRVIEREAGAPCASTDDAGLPGTFREAAEMAVLGALCADRVPITLAQVTGLPTGTAAPLSGCFAGG